jgi:hypothetical protein
MAVVKPYAEGGETTAANGRLACGFHNRFRNSHPWPEWPQPAAPHADDHVETDPVSTSEPGDDGGDVGEGDDGRPDGPAPR